MKKIKYFSCSLSRKFISLFQKNIILNLTQYFVMKIPNERESQQIESNH